MPGLKWLYMLAPGPPSPEPFIVDIAKPTGCSKYAHYLDAVAVSSVQLVERAMLISR